MSTKKIKDLNPVFNNRYGVNNRYYEFFDLLMNSVKIVDSETLEEINFINEKFIKKTLFERGAVGFSKSLKQWFYVDGEGVGKNENYERLNFSTSDGIKFNVKASYNDDIDGNYIIYALPTLNTTMKALIEEATAFMYNCDIASRQNLDACKTPYIVVCKDENLKLSYEQAILQKQQGQAVVIVSEELGDGLKAVDIGVNYLVDKFTQARDRERDTLLTKLGIMNTGAHEKKERVQSAEVNATIGQCSDYLYMIIDTFNKQCNSYKLPFKMLINNSLEELYTFNDNEEMKGQNNND